jgi:hypothetical protein
MGDDDSLKIVYEAASAAFREIADRNVAVILQGGQPTAEEVRREEHAQDELATARRAYFKYLRSKAEDER